MSQLEPPPRREPRPLALIATASLAIVFLLAGCASTPPKSPTEDRASKPTLTLPPPLTPAPSTSASVRAGEWRPLFDGRTLAGWQETDFAGHGEVSIKGGQLILGQGSALTGVVFTNPLPSVDYEVALEASKLAGGDFFCGLTFPVRDTFCTLILGGWGGAVVGLSNVDGNDASGNDTTQFRKFDPGRWYAVRLRVTAKRIEVWLDEESVIDLDTSERVIALRFGEIGLSKPFGVASWQTTGALRNVRLRRLPTGPATPPPAPR